jgi:N-dimethylarginine dimethylaminohydrolase
LLSLRLQDRMHLDCVFSIIGDDVCIMMDEMMGEESPTRRLVDEWVQVPGCARASNAALPVS